MGVTYIRRVVTYLRCPRCQCNLGTADHFSGGPYQIGPPIEACPSCRAEFIVPENTLRRSDEWEMKHPSRKSQLFNEIKEDYTPPTASSVYETGCILGGCLGVLVFIGTLGAAIGLGAGAVLENRPLVTWAAGAGLVVALGLPVYLAHFPGMAEKRRKDWYAGRIKQLEDLISRIEDSRRRMSDPEYRNRLRQMGLPVRGPREREPPDSVADLERIRQRLAELKAAAAAPQPAGVKA